jgi:hypothetical protein
MASKLSLADVLPLSETVGIGGDKEIEVYGISGGDFAKIMQRYPDAFQQLTAAGVNPSGMSPGLVGAVIAATQRKYVKVNGPDSPEISESLLGDEAAEAAGRNLSMGAQLKVIMAMGRCSFPDGIGPFLEGIESVSKAAKEAMEVVVRVVSRAKPMDLPPMPKPSDASEPPPSGG